MSTYTPITSQTLTASSSSVSFVNIPQTYTDLILVCSIKGSAGGQAIFTLNSDTGSNYSSTYLESDGSTTYSGRRTNQTAVYDCIQYNTAEFSTAIVHIMNYSNTNVNKTILSRNGRPSTSLTGAVALWRSTSAITSLNMTPTGGTISSGTTFNLYGIADAGITNSAKATGGNSVTTDGTYWYHTFTSSGTFTPTQSLTADYLVVAGGGSGGTNLGGGGGAGGMRCTVTATGGGGSLESALSLLASTNYTVTIGAGGASTSATNSAGNSGSNSVFSTITATGGGGGGNRNTNNGIGISPSGGGGYGTTGTGASGTANQSYAGGNAFLASGAFGAGGGGGTGQAGSNGTSSTGGKGGDGTATSISGSSVTYGGGGGGGADTTAAGSGGSGGGGNGAVGGGTPTSGTANSGSGGGGSGSFVASGAGGSGIVIVRYAV